MNKLYIYVLFIIFGLCIFLYINKLDKFNIGGPFEIQCDADGRNLFSLIMGFIYTDPQINCYDTPCTYSDPNYNDAFRKQYMEDKVMLIENDIYNVIIPILSSSYMNIYRDDDEFKNTGYTRLFNYKGLINSEEDTLINGLLDYFIQKDIIKITLNDDSVFNNVFTSNALDSSEIFLQVEDITNYFGSDSQINEQTPVFSESCREYLKDFDFRLSSNNVYNHWHQDTEYIKLQWGDSFPYYLNCIITPPGPRKGPLYRILPQKDCLYMDTQVSTNLTNEIKNIYNNRIYTPESSSFLIENNGRYGDDTDNIDESGDATSDYIPRGQIIEHTSKVLRENQITGIMFDNYDKFHSRATFNDTNGIILNNEKRDEFKKLYKDTDSDEWISANIREDGIYDFKQNFKNKCASDFITLPTYESVCRRIIRITLLFKEQ